MKAFDDFIENKYAGLLALGEYKALESAFKAGIKFALESAREQRNHIQHRLLVPESNLKYAEDELSRFAVWMEREIEK